MLKLLVLLALLLNLTACVGPLLGHDVGRSLGHGNHNIKAMSTTEGYAGFSYDAGIGKNLELGFQIEALSIGVRTKYSFINQKSGFSAAGQLGIGETYGGDYYIVGLIGSSVIGKWEPFASVKYTKVSVDPAEFGDEDTGDIFVTIPASDFDYYIGNLGTKYWFADWFGLSLEASSIFSSDGDEVEFEDNTFYSVAADFRF